MKRNMDLIRELLLKLEALDVDPRRYVSITRDADEIAVPGFDVDQIEHHMEMLYDAGFIEPGTSDGARGDQSGECFYFQSITWPARDWLDTVRDPKIWNRAKDAGTKVGGWSISILGEIAKGLIKGELQKLGVPLG